MRPILFFICFTATTVTHSQDASIITVKAGEDMSVLYGHVYHYSQFLPGRVYFTSDSARSRFNYNRLDDRFEFIGEKNDTLVIADERSVRQVIINQDSFYFHNGGYLLSVGDYGFTRLLVKESLKLVDEKNIGSYGISSSTHTIESKRTLLSLQTMTLQLNKDLVFSREHQFFLLHKDNYLLATRKNILKLLDSKEKSFVEGFIATQAIDLKKQEDLQKLFQYIVSLKKQ